MSCLEIKLCGIPDAQLQGLCQIIALQATQTVHHFDVFTGERHLLTQTPLPNGGYDSGHESAQLQGKVRYVRERTHTIALKIRSQYLTSFIKVVKQFGVGELFGSIDILEVRCTTEELPINVLPLDPAATWWDRLLRAWNVFNSTTLNRLSTLEIHSSIVANSFMSFNHIACILLASGMAAIGLLTDSSVDVLASFFVSPLMQMLLAVVWGLTVQDFRLSCRGARNMFLGAFICVLCGLSFGVLLSVCYDASELAGTVQDGTGATSFISISTHQIMSRGPPDGNVMMAAIMAALSGIAIALGQGSGISSALTGVTLSTSLLPPLVNAGMMWSLQLAYPSLKTSSGYSLAEVGRYSFYLYMANISCIVLFSWTAFKFKHIGGKTLRPMFQQGILAAADADDTRRILRTFSHDCASRSRHSSESHSLAQASSRPAIELSESLFAT